jgi:hypothetical protein
MTQKQCAKDTCAAYAAAAAPLRAADAHVCVLPPLPRLLLLLLLLLLRPPSLALPRTCPAAALPFYGTPLP